MHLATYLLLGELTSSSNIRADDPKEVFLRIYSGLFKASHRHWFAARNFA